MVCLRVEPGVTEWKAQTNPLYYGVNPKAGLSRRHFCYISFKI